MLNVNAAAACNAPAVSLGPRSATSMLPPAELSLQEPLLVTILAASPLVAISFNPEPPVTVNTLAVPVTVAPVVVNA